MKQSILALGFLLVLANCYSQTSQKSQPFTIDKIGLTFYPPDGFTLVDSSSHDMSPSKDIKLWLQSFLFKYGSSNLVISLSTSTQKNIDWQNIYKKEANHFYEQTVANSPGTKFDSSLTTITLDSKLFTKFTMIGKKDGVITYNNVKLSTFINGIRVGIGYYYINPEAADQFDKSLATAKFKD